MGAIRLKWDGKTAEVPRLPLQTVETVNSPRADRGTLSEPSRAPPGHLSAFRLGESCGGSCA